MDWHDVLVVKVAILTRDVSKQKEFILISLAHEVLQWILKFLAIQGHHLAQNVTRAL